MRETLSLGQVAGVRVGVNWSVLAIFLLITFGLAAGRFPLLYPDLSTGAYAAAGLTAAVIFLLSLLAHEVSHAVVAQRNGVEVEGITLWMLGGVARLEGEAADPGAELAIAGVGPLVSVVLGVVFGGLAIVLEVAGAAGIVVGVFVWLGVINIVLAVFNLIPAAPLDGGRILTAWLWKRRGNRTSAAVTAARAGKGFGWFLVALGFVQFVFLAGFGGLWFVLIGWFLTMAAGAEEQQAEVSAALGDTRVADVMSADPAVAPADLSLEVFLRDYVFPSRYSTFPVTDPGGAPAGLITLRRVKEVPEAKRASTHVGEVACSLDDLPVVEPHEALADVLPRMRGCADGRALVVSGGRVVGIVSPTDVMRTIERAELQRGRDLQRV